MKTQHDKILMSNSCSPRRLSLWSHRARAAVSYFACVSDFYPWLHKLVISSLHPRAIPVTVEWLHFLAMYVTNAKCKYCKSISIYNLSKICWKFLQIFLLYKKSRSTKFSSQTNIVVCSVQEYQQYRCLPSPKERLKLRYFK